MSSNGASEDPRFSEMVRAFAASDAAGLSRLLALHPELRLRLDDPNPQGSFGSTLLLTAVQRRNREMIDALLNAGADINARSHWWAGSFGVLDQGSGLEPYLIERGAFVDSYAAARLGMLARLEELVAADPNAVHWRGGDGQTPLHVAANIEVARFLVEHGADIDAHDVDHESTPAQYLVRSQPEVARFLLERGGQADLLLAAALGNLPRVRKFLDTDPSLVRMRVSPHFFPMKNPRAGGTIYLWTLGNHKSAHEIAREFGHEDVFQLLLERSPDDLKLQLACLLGDEKTFDALLASKPAFARELSDDDRRKLPDAAQGNNLRAVRLMLKAGWPVESRGQHGATALHWAAWHGNAEIAEEILRYKPAINDAANDFHATPLGWANHGSENSWHRKTGNYPAIIQLLSEAGGQ